MILQFAVYGEPVGKGRPKFSTVNGHAVAYTPKKTASFENLVILSYKQLPEEKPFEKDVPLKVSIGAYFSIPKSATKKKRQAMLDEVLRPTKKPDGDNIAKAVCDALNGVAYYDDSQVVELTVSKYYSDNPKTIIRIEEIEANGDRSVHKTSLQVQGDI